MIREKVVMVFGTFGILHPGHLYFLKQAKEYGNELIAVVARDVTVKKIKGFLPKLNEAARQEMVAAFKVVDKAILGDKVDWRKVIREYKPDIICLGYDQKTPRDFEKQLKKIGRLKVIRLKAHKPKKYKSSKILK